MKKKERGITLIALIITIIVLLILAVITIMALMGDHSILKQSKRATRETNRQGVRELVQLEVLDSYDENGFSMDKFKEKLEKEYGVNPKDIEETEDGGISFVLDGYIITVTEDEDRIDVQIEGDGDET